MMVRWFTVLLIAIGVVVVAAPGGASAQTATACPAGVTLTVAAPTAAAPTTVTVSLSQTLNIKPASAADPTSFHVHYFVDTDATAAGQVVPTGNPKIIHSATTTQDLGSLSAGSHTVTVVLGQFNHTACETRGSATFTVASPLPTTGSGGDSSSGIPLATELALVTAMIGVLGLGAGLLMRSRRA